MTGVNSPSSSFRANKKKRGKEQLLDIYRIEYERSAIYIVYIVLSVPILRVHGRDPSTDGEAVAARVLPRGGG